MAVGDNTNSWENMNFTAPNPSPLERGRCEFINLNKILRLRSGLDYFTNIIFFVSINDPSIYNV